MGRGVPVHPDTTGVEQDRTTDPITDGVLDRPSHGGRQRHQHDTAALPDNPQDPVAVLLTC
jgi:hypothetical protein